MNKYDFFLAAMKAQEYRRRAWLITALALIQEAPDAWRKNPYPYRIVQTPTQFFYVDPDNGNELSPIEGGVPGTPLFAVTEYITLKPGDVPNLTEPLKARIGNVIYNYVTMVHALNSKLPFQTGRINAKKIEEKIVKIMVDDPLEGEERAKDKIYVSEYLEFVDATFFLVCLTQICVPAATPKSMVAAPGIHEYRNKLLAEQPDRHTDPAFVAEVDAKLVQYDRDYLKDDRSSDFYIKSKSFDIVRKKRFGMHGAEVGIEESVGIKLIPNSLSEGWDINYFPEMNDSLRTGSYNRGAQTMLGGESVKWLLRASSNISIAADDCETTNGIERSVDDSTMKSYIGYSMVVGKATVVIDEQNIKPYLGKTVILRSPMYCKTPKNGYCKVCCGPKLSINPTGLSTAVSEYGSAFLGMYMSAAHAKAVKLATIDLETAFT